MSKASGGDGIPVELFQTLKDERAALNMPANLENSAVTPGLEMVSFLHYNLGINPLVDVEFTNMLSPSVGCLLLAFVRLFLLGRSF